MFWGGLPWIIRLAILNRATQKIDITTQRKTVMKICNYFCRCLKVIMKFSRTKTMSSLALVALLGMSTSTYAALITINAIAPSQGELDTVGIPLSEATDFCIGSTGDGINANGLGSGITEDYSITPGGGFASSQNISGGGLGLTNGGIGVSDWIPDSPLNNPEAVCFDFPDDPVGPSELFSVVLDANWLEDSDLEESTILELSGLDILDCFFSYHDSDDDIGNAISPTYYVPGNCGVTLDPPSTFFSAAKEAQLVFDDKNERKFKAVVNEVKEAQLVFDDGNVQRFRAVSTPSMSMITLLLIGGLFMRPAFKSKKV
jgi:hypothetical protein